VASSALEPLDLAGAPESLRIDYHADERALSPQERANIAARMQDGHRFWNALRSAWTPAVQTERFPRIILHASRSDFETSLQSALEANRPRSGTKPSRNETPLAIEANALYDSRANTLHAPAAVSAATLRHELTHALVYAARSDAPYWLHEGLARLLETQAAAPPADCAAMRARGLAPELRTLLPRMQERSVGFRLEDLERRPLDAGAAPLAAYFVLYLWNRRSLARFARDYLNNPDRTPAFEQLLQSTGLPKAELETGFARWMQSDAPAGPISGC